MIPYDTPLLENNLEEKQMQLANYTLLIMKVYSNKLTVLYNRFTPQIYIHNYIYCTAQNFDDGKF